MQYYYCCTFLLLLHRMYTLPQLSAMEPNVHFKPLDILIFGGNGFIGSHITEKLLFKGHQITLINRNSWSWNTASTIKPLVNKILTIDRLTKDGEQTFLRHVVSERLSGPDVRPYDLVIDFSAYRPSAVKPYYKMLAENKLCKLYLFISSDSVYEVCSLPENSAALIEESFAARPEGPEVANELKSKDSYGHRKLKIEEFLRGQRHNGSGIPYIIFRLPDVLGQRDSTERWWKYQLWLENYDVLDVPIPVPNFARNLKTSYVYVKDVAKLIDIIAERIATKDNVSAFTDKVFNVAYPEPRLLHELLVHIKQAARADRARIVAASKVHDSTADNIFYFPSVTRGALNISLLRKTFPEFEFTPWETIIHEIVQFYKLALSEYPGERDRTAGSLCNDLNIDSQKCNSFMAHLLVATETQWKQEL